MKSIIELCRAVTADPDRSKQAIEAFIARNAFPMLEGDTATFFFWDGRPAESVHLVHWVFGLESHLAFERVPGTDAFWLAMELPHSARTEYKFKLTRGGRSAWIRDPHNPRRAFDPFGSNSVCPMPGYHEPRWVEPDPDCRTGRMERFEIASQVWGDTRTVQVYLPNEHHPRKAYPLVICHDGTDYLRFTQLQTVLDNLIGRHEVIPLIVAFVDGGRRNEEFGAHPDHPRWIVDEVLPAIEARYRISPGAANRGIMGASFGAVAALWTHWNRPGVFGRLLLQSGSFAFTDVGRHDRGPLWDPVVGFVNELRREPGRLGGRDLRLYMSCGQFESLIYYNRSLQPILQQAGFDVRFTEVPDGHNWICWRDRLREGLAWLFPGYLWMIYD
jgi:enterochelin esterase-like enzyme